MSDTLKLIGSNIRTARKYQKLSQEQLAEKAGVDYRYIGFLEQGRGNPTLNSLDKVVNALNMDFIDLLLPPGTWASLGSSTDAKRRNRIFTDIVHHLYEIDLDNLEFIEYIIKGLIKKKSRL